MRRSLGWFLILSITSASWSTPLPHTRVAPQTSVSGQFVWNGTDTLINGFCGKTLPVYEKVTGTRYTMGAVLRIYVECFPVVSKVSNSFRARVVGVHVDERGSEMWWMTWRAPVHYEVDDVASTGTPCGG